MPTQLNSSRTLDIIILHDSGTKTSPFRKPPKFIFIPLKNPKILARIFKSKKMR